MFTPEQEFIHDRCEQIIEHESETIQRCKDAAKNFIACLSEEQKKKYMRLEAEQLKAFDILVEKIYIGGKTEAKI